MLGIVKLDMLLECLPNKSCAIEGPKCSQPFKVSLLSFWFQEKCNSKVFALQTLFNQPLMRKWLQNCIDQQKAQPHVPDSCFKATLKIHPFFFFLLRKSLKRMPNLFWRSSTKEFEPAKPFCFISAAIFLANGTEKIKCGQNTEWICPLF